MMRMLNWKKRSKRVENSRQYALENHAREGHFSIAVLTMVLTAVDKTGSNAGHEKIRFQSYRNVTVRLEMI